MDDFRYIWLRDKIFTALDIVDTDVFEEFLNREDGGEHDITNEAKIAKFMNQTEEDEDFALVFSKDLKEEAIEIELELCKMLFFYLEYEINTLSTICK
jgi:hypothetical protein